MSLLKRNTYQPQEVETISEPKEGFAMIDFRDIDTVIENLTAAEMKLWLYLQKLDRYGEKWKGLPTPKELAIRLGLSKRTVEKAMFRLDDLGLYVIRIKHWEGVNSSAARAHQTAKKMKAAKKEREAPEPLQDGRGYLAANTVNLPNDVYLTENAVNLPSERLNNRNQPPQPAPSKDSAIPQTIQTYSDFIETLSEGEREKFLDWSKNKVAGYKKKVVNLDDYLASQDSAGQNRWEIFHKEFKQEATENQLETSQDEQNKILRRRAEAQEFLSRSKEDLHLDQNSAPPREKSAAAPPDFAEIDKLLDEPEGRSEGSKCGANSTGVDRGLVDKLKKQKQQRGFGFRNKKT